MRSFENSVIRRNQRIATATSPAKLYADSTTESWNYDLTQGRLATSTNARRQTKTFSYTPWNEMAAVTYAPPSNSAELPTPNVGFTYDTLGRPQTMTDGIGTTVWSYDNAGRVIKDDGPWANDELAYGYDELSRLNLMLTRRDASNNDEQDYLYDTMGRLSSLKTSRNGLTWNWTYVGWSGNPLTQDAPNGTHTEYSYEGGGTLRRMTRVTNQAAIGGAILSRFSYGYGSAASNQGNIKSLDTRQSQTRQYGNDIETAQYSYDDTSMLIEEAVPSSDPQRPKTDKYYFYDTMGNRIEWGDRDIQSTIQVRTEASYNNLNQLTDANFYRATVEHEIPQLASRSHYSYDGDGNMT